MSFLLIGSNLRAAGSEGPDRKQEKTFGKERNLIVCRDGNAYGGKRKRVGDATEVDLTVVRKIARVNLFCLEKYSFSFPPSMSRLVCGSTPT